MGGKEREKGEKGSTHCLFALKAEIYKEEEEEEEEEEGVGVGGDHQFPSTFPELGAELEPGFDPPIPFAVRRFGKGGEKASAPGNIPLFFTKITSSDLFGFCLDKILFKLASETCCC